MAYGATEVLAPFLQHPTDAPDKIVSAAYRVVGGTEVSKNASARQLSRIASAAYCMIGGTEVNTKKIALAAYHVIGCVEVSEIRSA